MSSFCCPERQQVTDSWGTSTWQWVSDGGSRATVESPCVDTGQPRGGKRMSHMKQVQVALKFLKFLK